MKTIYLDSDFKCHLTNDGTMDTVETDYFDNKCDAFIEGYRFVPNGKNWVRDDGEKFLGEMIAPWKNYEELDGIQRNYEKQLLQQQKAEIAELDALILDLQYNNLVEEYNG